MDFIINKNATLPIMKLDVIQDGRNDMKKSPTFGLIALANNPFTKVWLTDDSSDALWLSKLMKLLFLKIWTPK